MGDRLSHLRQCVDVLSSEIENVALSSVYESDAMLRKGSPPEWDIKFLNMVVSGHTNLLPMELLAFTQETEVKLGRMADHPLWSPREIDIDILAYEDQIINLNNLNIPHPAIIDRQFFLMPLAEICPDFIMPTQKVNCRTLANSIEDNPLNTYRTGLHV